jgi:hypothetical protein
MNETEMWRLRAMKAEALCWFLMVLSMATAAVLVLMGWWVERGGL